MCLASFVQCKVPTAADVPLSLDSWIFWLFAKMDSTLSVLLSPVPQHSYQAGSFQCPKLPENPHGPQRDRKNPSPHQCHILSSAYFSNDTRAPTRPRTPSHSAPGTASITSEAGRSPCCSLHSHYPCPLDPSRDTPSSKPMHCAATTPCANHQTK